MTDERTIAYLLNELPEHEAAQFEEQCFSQPEWPDAELESAEEDLIQAYIRNELSPERRRRFEEHYLTTAARKERLLFARSFLGVVCTEAAPAQPSWPQKLLAVLKSFALAPRSVVPRFATILLAVGLVATLWFAFRTRTPQTFANINLVTTSENRSTSGPTQKVTLPLAEDALRISLTLPDGAPRDANYRVLLEDVKGPLQDLEIEKQDAKSISVIIPSDKLTRGQHTVKLFRKNPDGREERSGNYFFDVE